MAIGADSVIEFFGTQDQVDDGTTSTIANDAFSAAADISAWTNDDDAPEAVFVLECQFDTTMPSVGSILLFARLLNIQSTNDVDTPDANNLTEFLGRFTIPYNHAADSNFFTALRAQLPNHKSSQEYEFYLQNDNTSQTIGVDWNLWITPVTVGPHA